MRIPTRCHRCGGSSVATATIITAQVALKKVPNVSNSLEDASERLLASARSARILGVYLTEARAART